MLDKKRENKIKALYNNSSVNVIDTLTKAIKNDSHVDIIYKGNKRTISPIEFVGDNKIEAIHIKGYTSSNSNWPRTFFISEIEIQNEITKEKRLQGYLNSLNIPLKVTKGNVVDGMLKKIDTIILKSKKDNSNKYIICPGNSSSCYVLIKWECFSKSSLFEGYYIIDAPDNFLIKNPEGEEDYENDGGSSKYRFYDVKEIALALNHKKVKNSI